MKKLFKNFFALLAVSASCTAFGQVKNDEFLLGAMTHFGCHYKGIVDANMEMLRDAGINSPRDSIGWEIWEPSRNKYIVPRMFGEYFDKCKEFKLRPLTIINHGHPAFGSGYPKSKEYVDAYAQFAAHIVRQWKGKCDLYQVWNEWDGGCAMPPECKGQGDPLSYAVLLEAAYAKMKEADPSVTVVANSVCTGERFLEDTLKAGILKNCDGIAFHAYNYNKAEKTPEDWLKRMEGIDKMLRSYNNGKPFPIYATEIGWPNYTKRGGTTEDQTADFIARLYLLARTLPSIKGVWWYDFQDDGFDHEYNEDNFGIVRTDLTPKEPYYVLKSIAEIVKKGQFIEKIQTDDKDLVILKFKMPDSSDVLAFWSLAADHNLRVTFKNSAKEKTSLRCFLAGFAEQKREWGARDWVDKKTAPVMDDKLMVTVKGRPYIMRGDLSGLTVESVKRIEFPDLTKSARKTYQAPAIIGEAIPLSSKNSDRVYDFSSAANYRIAKDKSAYSKDSLESAFSLRYDDDYIYLSVRVTDDIDVQKNPIDSMWMSDSIQVAFYALDKGNPEAWTEYCIGETDKGLLCYREVSQIKLSAGQAEKVEVKREKDGKTSVWNIKFPREELALKGLDKDKAFGFSILVNDDDGSGRKGYLRWGDGISPGKNPLLYNWIVLKGE